MENTPGTALSKAQQAGLQTRISTLLGVHTLCRLTRLAVNQVHHRGRAVLLRSEPCTCNRARAAEGLIKLCMLGRLCRRGADSARQHARAFAAGQTSSAQRNPSFAQLSQDDISEFQQILGPSGCITDAAQLAKANRLEISLAAEPSDLQCALSLHCMQGLDRQIPRQQPAAPAAWVSGRGVSGAAALQRSQAGSGAPGAPRGLTLVHARGLQADAQSLCRAATPAWLEAVSPSLMRSSSLQPGSTPSSPWTR